MSIKFYKSTEFRVNIIIILLTTQSYVFANESKIQREPMQIFNSHMDKIDFYNNKKNLEEFCIHIKSSIKILNSNLNELREIEPNYNWKEIKNALWVNQKKYCKK